jgi:hypothetical protein
MRHTTAVLVAVLLGTWTSEAAVLCARRNGSLRMRDEVCKRKETQVDPDALGLRGPAGPPGAPGADGTALGYAYVFRTGSISQERSKNVTNENLDHPSDGVYCFHSLPFTPSSIVATNEEGVAIRATLIADAVISCRDTDQAAVLTFEFLPGVDRSFYVVFN